MIHNHSLIFKDYSSLHSLLSEPSGCVQTIYSAILKDLLAYSNDEKTTLDLFNEALWICTRVLTDLNPELHFNLYFPIIDDSKSKELTEQNIIKAIVYGVLKQRQSTDFFIEQFLSLFDADNKGAEDSLKHVYKKLTSDWQFLHERVVDLHPYKKDLYEIEKCLTDKYFVCDEEFYNWLDIVPDMLGNFDVFYTQQVLGILPINKQKNIISKLWDLTKKHEDEFREGTIIGISIIEEWPEFWTKLHSWHYSYTSVHGTGLDIPPCKLYDKDNFDDLYAPDTTPKQVAYDRDKAIEYYATKKRVFKEKKLPEIESSLIRWWNTIPEDKREEAIKEKQNSFTDALMKSGFCGYCDAQPSLGHLKETVYYADSQEEAQMIMDQEYFTYAMSDFYQNTLDVLDVEKIEKYIWENQNRLTDEQIFAFFAYNEVRTYLPNMMRKASADGMVDEKINNLKEDDMTKASLVNRKGIAEQDVDGKTDFFVMEIYDENETKLYNLIPELKNNKDAIVELKNILSSLNPKINARKGKRSEKWQWPHVCDALKQLNLIDKDITPTDFGNTINGLLSDRSAQSVTQSFKTGRINEDYPNITDTNIISEIAKLFEPVRKMIYKEE